MIGRADIEESKSNVAMNAWLPQASYPCGNFSDTSHFKFQKLKGSIGHGFPVCIRTENQNQVSFYPFVLHEISVLIELTLGHLCYSLTDVPPQPNSPSGQCLAALGRTEKPCLPHESEKPRISGWRPSPETWRLPFPFNAMSKATIRVVVFHRRCKHLPPILHLECHCTSPD